MKINNCLFLILFGLCFQSFSQLSDPLFDEIIPQNKNKIELLPDKMLITQRLFWGKNGILRKTGISKLDFLNRDKEIKVRRAMLKSHQVIGYLTFLGMLAQGYLGGRLYNGENSLYDIHKKMGKAVNISYFTGAALSLFAPPPILNKKKKGFNSIKAHKFLGSMHFSAMVATNIFSDKNKKMHKNSAYVAFTSYALAIIVFKF